MRPRPLLAAGLPHDNVAYFTALAVQRAIERQCAPPPEPAVKIDPKVAAKLQPGYGEVLVSKPLNAEMFVFGDLPPPGGALMPLPPKPAPSKVCQAEPRNNSCELSQNLIDVPEAASLLGVSESWVRRHIAELPTMKFLAAKANRYSTSALKTMRTLFSMMLGWAADCGWIERNPCTRIALPVQAGGKRVQRTALTPEQVVALAGKLEEPYATLVLFLYVSGLRRVRHWLCAGRT